MKRLRRRGHKLSIVNRGALAASIHDRCDYFGISLRTAAKQMGVPASTLSRLDSGKNPSLESFGRITAWLNPHDFGRFFWKVPL